MQKEAPAPGTGPPERKGPAVGRQPHPPLPGSPSLDESARSSYPPRIPIAKECT